MYFCEHKVSFKSINRHLWGDFNMNRMLRICISLILFYKESSSYHIYIESTIMILIKKDSEIT